MLFDERAGSERKGPGPGARAVLAPLAFVLVAAAFAPCARLLRYATLGASELPAPALLLVPAFVAAAFLHEKLVRGLLYGALGRFLPTGLGAPLVALAGVVAPLGARLALFPVPRVSPWTVGVHGFLVEYTLSLALAWIALGTASTVPGGFALSLLWVFRLLVSVRFHGSAVPVLELLAAIGAAWAVVVLLREPLAPHREAMEEAP